MTEATVKLNMIVGFMGHEYCQVTEARRTNNKEWFVKMRIRRLGPGHLLDDRSWEEVPERSFVGKALMWHELRETPRPGRMEDVDQLMPLLNAAVSQFALKEIDEILDAFEMEDPDLVRQFRGERDDDVPPGFERPGIDELLNS